MEDREEPEREVHAGGMTKEHKNDDATLALIGVIQGQQIFLEDTEEEKASEVLQSFLCNSWSLDSDDDNDSRFSQDVEEFRKSIQAIKEQASRVDKLLAFDQMESLQLELATVKKTLSTKSQEIEELKTLVGSKNERLAILELERDLHQADSKNMKRDLDRCVVDIRTLQDQISHYRSQSQSTPPREITLSALIEQPLRTPSPIRTELRPPSQANSPPNFPGHEQVNIPAHCLPLRCHMGPRKIISRQKANALAITSLEARVDDLTERLQASMNTSSELRQKLVLVAHYYERATKKLNQKVKAIELRLAARAGSREDYGNESSKARLAREIIREKWNEC